MREISWTWVLAFCLVMFIGVIAARGLFGERYEVKINDILVLVLPFLLWLFATGQISSFEFGGEKIAIKAVFAEAGRRPIVAQISKIPVQTVSIADKGALSEIQTLLNKRIEALSLHVNTNNYYDNYVFSQYIQQLSVQTTFKWLVIMDKSGVFVGAIEILDGGKALLQGGAADRLVDILNMKRPTTDLTTFAGFVPATDSVSANAEKQAALEKMDAKGMSWLPVANSDGQFVGIVDRGRLTTSLILDVSKSLQAGASAK